MRIFFLLPAALLFVVACNGPAEKEPDLTPEPASEFVSIFNGETLEGWEGDSLYWKVSDGRIIGEITPETVLQKNTFLVWTSGEVRDFELKAQYRITAGGNSGINYRSERVDDVPYALKGYQGDIDGFEGKPYTGMCYEERGRTIIARRGQKVVLPPVPEGDSMAQHARNNEWTLAQVTGELGNADSLTAAVNDPGEWNEYHIIAKGNHLQHFINGVKTCDITDNDPVNSRAAGLLGVQVHVGPPMKIEFRDIRLKKL